MALVSFLVNGPTLSRTKYRMSTKIGGFTAKKKRWGARRGVSCYRVGMDPRTLYLVDGSGFIFRAYYALPQTLTNPAGTPVGAVLGFTNMLAKLLADLGARRVAVVFDAARKNFRNDIYPDYKAHRPPAPEDLVPQFPLFRAAAQAFGLPAIEVEGFEADDLIAAYAAAEPGPVVIVGSDKDLYQLVSERVTLWDPIKGAEIGVAGLRPSLVCLLNVSRTCRPWPGTQRTTSPVCPA